MPPCISGIIRMRKSDWKSAQALSGNPSTRAHQIIESGMQRRGVRRLAKRLLWTVAKPYNRTRPCRRVIGIAARLVPKDLARICRDFSREGILQFHQALADKLLSLRIAQHAMPRLSA